MDAFKGALDGLFVLDMSRIMAGPTATQLMGDLGATVIKVENPKTGGDDTRSWGPVYAKNTDGSPSDLSAYFMSANRNKQSIALDITTDEGKAIIHKLAARADVLIENYKPGGLKKYGLDFETMCAAHPGLVYCSISGFGQTGPNREQPGYDLMAQGFGGIMSITGEPDGQPMKVATAVADVICGLYATVGILAALRHRDATGEGQHIDIGLVDATMSWLVNQATNYLNSGNPPQRQGNAHPNIVPYEAFEASDGWFLLAVGNDGQFARFCDAFGLSHLADDPRYKTNPERIKHRPELVALVADELRTHSKAEILKRCRNALVPAGPINTIPDAMTSDQAQAREMVLEMPKDGLADGHVRLLGNPLKLSRTPVRYAKAPPRCGEDTEAILDMLHKDP